MQRDELIAQLRAAKPELESKGVNHLALFGSRARGDFRSDSDVDVLLDVVAHRPFSLLDLVEIERLVASKTRLQTNAFMRRSLDNDFKASIARDVIEVF
jgi:uncharacterized protein